MDVPLDWTCPICWQSRIDITYMIPCFHQVCYGCAFWWAKKTPRCAVCGNKTCTIRFSVRSDEDYLECSVPQPAEHSDYGLQYEQESAEPVLLPPEHSFPHEVWAAFFEEHPEDLEPLLQWLQEEIEWICGSRWWEVFEGQCTITSILCMHGLNQVALLQGLCSLLKDHTVSFVRRFITTVAAMYGPELRRQQDSRDAHATGGQEDSPVATLSLTTCHQSPPASDQGRSLSPAGSGAEEPPGILRGSPGHPSTTTVPSEEQEEQAEAVGPCTQGTGRSSIRPRRPMKRKARSSFLESHLPRKRRRRRRRKADTHCQAEHSTGGWESHAYLSARS